MVQAAHVFNDGNNKEFPIFKMFILGTGINKDSVVSRLIIVD